MITIKRRFASGVWHITQDDDTFYILFEMPGYAPQPMFICKGAAVFSAMAECANAMYAELHPEVKWDNRIAKEIAEILDD